MKESKRSIRLLALLAATLLAMTTVFFAGSAANAWAQDPAGPAPADKHITKLQFSLIGYASGQTPNSVQVSSQTDNVSPESRQFFQSDPNAADNAPVWKEATGTFTHDFKYRVKITFSAKAGFDFDGLTTDNIKLDTGETAFKYDVASKTATFDLKRIPANYTLTFNTNGGSAIKSVTEPENTVIDLADYLPTKKGFKFAGWYADTALTQKMEKVTLGQNTTVYAKWTADTPATPDNPGDQSGPAQPNNPGDKPGPAPKPNVPTPPQTSTPSVSPGSKGVVPAKKKPHGKAQMPETGSHSLAVIPVSVLMTAAGAALLASRRRKANF
ncbi:InlB B-repeat-containing protein [uncultured Varibaculum sp.]|uniref:InlB B-repeat-containing protein n=1 Tax=uncultured Varibaculum sp. TaxID=413896 RepID=UPI0025936048|nr:InlB B-repeat-containing protein [uncultured Varibaculum sp.]